MTITKEVQFDMGHRLMEYAGPCSRLHGHRYRLVVSVDGVLQGKGSESGMVIDFAKLKATIAEVVGQYDHHTVLQLEDPLSMKVNPERDGVVLLHWPPTAENLAQMFFDMLALRLGLQRITLVRVQLWETPTSMAEVTRE